MDSNNTDEIDDYGIKVSSPTKLRQKSEKVLGAAAAGGSTDRQSPSMDTETNNMMQMQ